MGSTSNFLRTYEADMGKFTDAPDIYHRASAYTIFGAALTTHKNRLIMTGGVPPRWTNLWTVLVGDAGIDRKSTAVGMAEEVLTRVYPDLLAPNDGSTEGFISHLVERHRNVSGNASSLMVQAEFSNLLHIFQKTYGASLKTLLMDFYDVRAVYKRQLAKSRLELERPRVSILGGIAIELLPSLTKQEDWLGGFFSRCLLVTGKKSKALAVAGDVPEQLYDHHAKRLAKTLKRWRQSQIKARRPRVKFSPEAEKVYTSLPDLPEEPNLRLTLGRASTHLQKLAAIEQVDEDPEAVEIGKDAALRAMGFIEHWWKTVPDIVDACFARSREEFEGDRLAKRIRRYVLKHGGRVKQRDVLRNTGVHLDEFNKAMRSLVAAEWGELMTDESGITWLVATADTTDNEAAAAWDTKVKGGREKRLRSVSSTPKISKDGL